MSEVSLVVVSTEFDGGLVSVSIIAENLGCVREAEYRFRHEPLESRFGAMVIAGVHGKVPQKVLVEQPRREVEGE